MMKMAGWVHIDSLAYVHLFKASPEMRPIHTDPIIYQSIMKKESERFKKYLKVTSLVFMVTLFYGLISWVLNLNSYHQMTSIILLALVWIPFIFTLIPYLNYKKRANKP